MLIYNQEINNFIFDLEHLDTKFFESDYIRVFEKFISDKNCYGVYRDVHTWETVDKLMSKSSLTVSPIKYSIFASPYEVISNMDIDVLKTIYITDQQANVFKAHSVHLNTLLLISDNHYELERSKLPDHYCYSAEQLEALLEGKVKGYFNEVITCNFNFNSGKINTFNLSHTLYDDINAQLISGGRYFTSRDPRFQIHPLTKKILAYKDGTREEIGNQLSTVLKKNLTFTQKKIGKIDLITSVPSKPGSVDRIGLLLNNTNIGEFNKIVDCEVLCVNKDYIPQKDAKDWDSRSENVDGVFSINKCISGHVILVDDIVTSGSTAMECVRMLKEAGAEKVTIIALAVMQSRVESKTDLSIACSNTCEGNLKMRFNPNDASPFFGCSNFPECRFTVPLLRGCSNIEIREKLHTD